MKLFLALVLGASALTMATQAGGPSASAAPATAAPGCSFKRLPDDVDLTAAAGGVPRYAAWSQSPVNRQLLDSLHGALGAVFGPPEAKDGLGQLERGLIGLVLDHREQRFVVVLSRHLRLADYRAKVDRLVPSTRERGAAPVVVQHGCTSSAALTAGLRQASAGHGPAVRSAARVEPAASRVLVTLPAGVAAPRLAGLPAVTIERGQVRSRKGSRFADASPHFGAASISRKHAICTSWATVKRRSGRRMGVTAGHCGANGSVWRSGKYYYGKARGKRNFPEQDNMRLHGRNGHKWRPRIHVNGGARTVVGAGNPRVGQFVCKSGQSTGAVCGIEVLSIASTACYSNGCNRGLIFAEKACTGLLGLNCPTVGQGGDSGGPVFAAKPRSRAGIRGMEVAGSARNNLYAEKASHIQRHQSVRVLRRR